ncbi:MAG: hypothetical protein JSR60_08285 [Proteobacteria bacterium]|nr:hypothetical protein [Pseudomonadota bacterium]
MDHGQQGQINEVRVGASTRFWTARAIRRFYNQYSLNFPLPRKRHRDWIFAQHKDSIVPDVAEDLAHALPRHVMAALERLRSAKSAPYLVIRNAAHVNWSYPGDDIDFARKAHPGRGKVSDTAEDDTAPDLTRLERRKRRIDTLAGSLLWMLGAQVDFRSRRRSANSRLARNMVEEPFEPQLPDRQSRDMALRFHQSTTEYQLPYPKRSQDAPLTCSFKVVTCLTNIRRIPIFVLPVQEVLSRLKEETRGETIAALCQEGYIKSGPRADLFPFDPAAQGPVLMKDPLKTGPLDYLMSLDPARVWGIDATWTTHFLALRRALREAADSQAFHTVVLHRRDILIVDNQRALLSRREFDDHSFAGYLRTRWAGLRGKPLRWLRLLYGFPTGRSAAPAARD